MGYQSSDIPLVSLHHCGRLTDHVGIDGRQIVVPVVVLRPLLAGKTLGIPPYVPAARTLSVRIKRIPRMAARTRPQGMRIRLPLTFRTVDLHGIEN